MFSSLSALALCANVARTQPQPQRVQSASRTDADFHVERERALECFGPSAFERYTFSMRSYVFGLHNVSVAFVLQFFAIQITAYELVLNIFLRTFFILFLFTLFVHSSRFADAVGRERTVELRGSLNVRIRWLKNGFASGENVFRNRKF